ncbi:hypothetical protein [Vibrio penaeicida]|uniref:hypothetical protein n=1 Tax=Vibrio penaeicida TaxID=104609 RepID=UPI001CC5277E|nr:hypothetical protein [Vibrio penaeicida]
MTAEVEDGSGRWHPRPITRNRTTDAGDPVHILPLEDAIRDLTGQLALRRQAQASSAYQTLFAPSRDTRGVRREYRQAYLALEKERSKALAAMLDPTPSTLRPSTSNLMPSKRSCARCI